MGQNRATEQSKRAFVHTPLARLRAFPCSYAHQITLTTPTDSFLITGPAPKNVIRRSAVRLHAPRYTAANSKDDTHHTTTPDETVHKRKRISEEEEEEA